MSFVGQIAFEVKVAKSKKVLKMDGSLLEIEVNCEVPLPTKS
jgi:hypothetical protein